MRTSIYAVVFSAGLLTAAAYSAALAETATDYMDDTAISTKIKAELVRDEALKAFDIKVMTDQGVVDLSGTVHDPAQKTDAERIARAVKGVKDVKDEIVVQ